MDCIRCDEPIPAKRLEALPETRLCVCCSEDVGGDFIITGVLERTNKEGSMKVNYGSVGALQKRRRHITPLRRK